MKVRIETDDGQALEFNDTDTELFDFSTPHDMRDVTPAGSDSIRYEFTGTSHVKLSATFPPGKSPRWVDRA